VTAAPDSTEPAFSCLFAASVHSGLAGGFGADDGAVVSIEHFFATALAPVVVVIRTRGATQFQAFPLLTRVDAGNVALAVAAAEAFLVGVGTFAEYSLRCSRPSRATTPPTEAKRHTTPRCAPTFRRYTRRSCVRRRVQTHHQSHPPQFAP